MNDLKNRFVELFGGVGEGIRCFHAPGRVNIIGEHIDYNGGNVLPCALNMGTYALIRKNSKNKARFASTNFETMVEIPVNGADIAYDTRHGWANYPIGILHHMQADGHRPGGFDVLYSGNIPNGAGLSSSASIEVVTALALSQVFSLGYTMVELVKLAQKSENQFCGVNCGIMDQFAVGMAKKDSAIYLNCDSLEHRHIHLMLGGYKIVIMDTNKRRQLNESKYNERRAQCEEALAILSKAYPVRELAEISPEDFEAAKHLIPDEVIRKRARHVISENHRVEQAVETLEAGDIASLGRLITQSHNSLRDDYEVSCVELDTIVSQALANPACAGARMTGAGFGGCAIALVEDKATQGFIEEISANYAGAIGYAPNMYIQESGHGAREIEA